MSRQYFIESLKYPAYPREPVRVRFRRWKKPREGRIVEGPRLYAFYDRRGFGYACTPDVDPVEVTVISSGEKWTCYEIY